MNLPVRFEEVAAGSHGELAGLRRDDKGVRILLGEGPRPDLLGILQDGRLLWVGVKNLDRLSQYQPAWGDSNY